jgi:glycosyltransferase involved in cell wall biosynthesis
MPRSPLPSSPTVILVQPGANLDGAPFSGLMIATGLRQAGFRVGVIFGEDGPILPYYRRSDIEVHLIAQKNWLRSERVLPFTKHVLDQAWAARDMITMFRRLKPDLVYLNNLTCLAGAIAAKLLGIPTIWHSREMCSDAGGEMKIPRLFRKGLPLLLRYFSVRQIAVSRAVADAVFGAASPSIFTVPNTAGPHFEGPKTLNSELRTKWNLAPDAFVLGIPGSLRPVKGHSFLWQALPPLLAKWPLIQVRVCGSGEARLVHDLKVALEMLGISSRVHFIGNVDDMSAFYRACDLICIPSKSEGLGRCIIESFASALPVVSSRVGGTSELIQHGKNGLLVNYGDVEMLTSRLDECAGNPELRAQLGQNALTSYRELYSSSVHHRCMRTHVQAALLKGGSPIRPSSPPPTRLPV